jgi:hypothetical protein
VPVRWGRGSESEGAPAFWPWIEIVRDQLLRSDPADRKRLERAAAPLYRMLPQLKRPDDAHWADAPTLLLLRQLVRELGRDPVLLVVSFREEEMAREGPVAAALADLAGAPEARWCRTDTTTAHRA